MAGVLSFLVPCLGGTDASAGLAYEIGTTVDGAKFVRVAGVIGATDDVEAFAAAALSNRVTAVTFVSPGGNVRKAMELGRRIRAFQLSTIQTGASSVLRPAPLRSWAARRAMHIPTSIGVHRMWYPTSGR